jgi:hypothetical protein
LPFDLVESGHNTLVDKLNGQTVVLAILELNDPDVRLGCGWLGEQCLPAAGDEQETYVE